MSRVYLIFADSVLFWMMLVDQIEQWHADFLLIVCPDVNILPLPHSIKCWMIWYDNIHCIQNIYIYYQFTKIWLEALKINNTSYIMLMTITSSPFFEWFNIHNYNTWKWNKEKKKTTIIGPNLANWEKKRTH